MMIAPLFRRKPEHSWFNSEDDHVIEFPLGKIVPPISDLVMLAWDSLQSDIGTAQPWEHLLK